MELSRHLLLLLFLLAPPVCGGASNTYSNIITPGITITPSGSLSSLLSPSGDFAFGFRALNTNHTLFLLAIWFNKVPDIDKTIVWSANGDSPVRDDSTAELVAHSGNFSLKDHTGREIWGAAGNNATHAAILDTGNLVIAAADGAAVWQSFDNPTDTLLPTQILPMGGQLYARLMDDDYSKGRFQLVLQNNGNLSFYFVAVPSGFRYDSYWGSNTNGAAIQLVFDASATATYLSDNGTKIFNLTSSDFITGYYYQRATLDPDGIFRHYALPRDNPNGGGGGWEVQNFVPATICNSVPTHIGSGVCGFNSYCELDAGGRVDCQCPLHYSLIDRERKYRGCERDFRAQTCEPGGEALYDFVNETNIDWPLNAAEELSPMSEQDCRSNCLNDCLCTVAIYKTNTCWKKRYPLSNGRNGGDVGRIAFIKYSNLSRFDMASPEEDDRKIRSQPTLILILSLLLGVAVLLNTAVVVAFLYGLWRRSRRRPNTMEPTGLRSFTYKELEKATHGFSKQVGRGAFGTVYKGVLPGTTTAVAVKKLVSYDDDDEATENDFMNEVRSIGQTHHKNLVRMHGFCKEGTHRLLVYEFMSNGSLNAVLFGTDPPEWKRRAEIALGIAAGLAYLHEECRTQIIHCDIKPQNILLDGDFRARISDFGLAKLLGMQQTRTSTGLRGTIGYFAPEWFKNTPVTAKVDVYSFGVVLLEIVCCKRNLWWDEVGEMESSRMGSTLVERAAECYQSGRMGELVAEDDEARRDTVMLERFVMVAMWCLQEEPWMRPPMKKVMQMLEGAIAVTVPPICLH